MEITHDDYKLGRILGTSAITSDKPFVSIKPKRTTLKLLLITMIVAFAAYVYFPKPTYAMSSEQFDVELDAASDEAALQCLSLMQRINAKLKDDLNKSDISYNTKNLIAAFNSYCGNL